jgi:hypothetical protein
MQLMCHFDAYTDQALAVGLQVLLHHNGSNPKNPRAFLVHGAGRGLSSEVEGGSAAPFAAFTGKFGAR